MAKVLMAPSPLEGIDAEFRHTLLRAGFELLYPGLGRQLVESELADLLPGCKASLAGSEPYSREIMDRSPELKVIARVGVGYDAVDVPAATDHGVVVTITPGTNQDSVAEHTFMLLLACARQLVTQHNQVVAGKWPRNANVPVRGRTLGIIGLGRIGKAVALRGVAFGMPIVAFEPNPDHEFVAKHGLSLRSLDDVIREADYLSLHAPMMAESKYLINARTLALMKPTAYLINTSRGGLVNETDLLRVLKEHRIAGAALDVFEQEPPPANHPFFGLDNVILTAHTAGVDLRSRDDMALSAAQAIVDLSQGKWPAEKIVNPQVRSTFNWNL
jgi:D-3-phosphoglycerate dehydrogenase / 2-oxoglutarate reductase